jgi:hypothetical protein
VVDNVPNIGPPGPGFDAKEARWQAEIAATWAEFQSAAGVILAEASTERRSARLREYAEGVCRD